MEVTSTAGSDLGPDQWDGVEGDQGIFCLGLARVQFLFSLFCGIRGGGSLKLNTPPTGNVCCFVMVFHCSIMAKDCASEQSGASDDLTRSLLLSGLKASEFSDDKTFIDKIKSFICDPFDLNSSAFLTVHRLPEETVPHFSSEQNVHVL